MQARADLASLSRAVRHAVRVALRTKLAVNPYDRRWALPLRDEWIGFWRIRVGVYRVVYAIGHPGNILITDIGPPGIYGRRR